MNVQCNISTDNTTIYYDQYNNTNNELEVVLLPRFQISLLYKYEIPESSTICFRKTIINIVYFILKIRMLYDFEHVLFSGFVHQMG